MYTEGDTVRTLRNLVAKHPASWPGIQNEKLPEGSLGAILMTYGDGDGIDSDYEVEFVAADGSTKGLLTLKESELELVEGEDF